MPHLRVAVDIGGTFTDICIMDESNGEVRVAKTPGEDEVLLAARVVVVR